MIAKLFTQNFRNLVNAELSFQPGITVISGRNGQGKTNLLEAIHWVTQGWSFRARRFEDSVRFQAEEAWLRMEGSRQGDQKIQQGIHWTPQRTLVKAGETQGSGMAILHGHVSAVFLGPDDIDLVKDGPEGRRRYLDVLMCRLYPDGVDLLTRYRRTLAQRNRFLKDRRGTYIASGSPDEAVLDSLSEQLALLGARIQLRRQKLWNDLEPHLGEYYRLLSHDAESITGSLRTSVHAEEGMSEADVAAKIGRKLLALRNMELQQGITGTGPHRDDLELRFAPDGAPLRETASQGQSRTTALALGLVALDTALHNNSEPPILLLDDIFAELDAERRQALAQLIRTKNCQVFAATPRAEDLPFHSDTLLYVQSGQVSS